MSSERWPALPFEEWKETNATLHLWTQIVGKIRLQRMPWINHSWHVALYPTVHGLTTGAMPSGAGCVEIEFDFDAEVLRIEAGADGRREIALRPRSVADFYGEVMQALAELGHPVQIDRRPNEIPDALPFPEDVAPREFDADAARRFRRILLSTEAVFQEFRSHFLGKVSPVHFFWGSFDLAVTRFSGRSAPMHPGGIPALPDWVAREAYSHEVSSAGFWPGGDREPRPIFYSYAYPSPGGFEHAAAEPEEAFYHTDLGEFVLPYDAIRESGDPEGMLLKFLESTYRAAAIPGEWDEGLERKKHPREMEEFR